MPDHPAPSPVLTVREMQPAEIEVRISYFHDATDDELASMGVDRTKLPARAAWRANYAEDFARPFPLRQAISLVWERDGHVVGFSAADHLEFGHEAFMHLHVLRAADRRRGLGTEFVRQSARFYLDILELERLYCEPNALNVAPNRTLQRAGFHYQFSHATTPGPMNFPQVTTRWLIEPHDLA